MKKFLFLFSVLSAVVCGNTYSMLSESQGKIAEDKLEINGKPLSKMQSSSNLSSHEESKRKSPASLEQVSDGVQEKENVFNFKPASPYQPKDEENLTYEDVLALIYEGTNKPATVDEYVRVLKEQFEKVKGTDNLSEKYSILNALEDLYIEEGSSHIDFVQEVRDIINL